MLYLFSLLQCSLLQLHLYMNLLYSYSIIIWIVQIVFFSHCYTWRFVHNHFWVYQMISRLFFKVNLLLSIYVHRIRIPYREPFIRCFISYFSMSQSGGCFSDEWSDKLMMLFYINRLGAWSMWQLYCDIVWSIVWWLYSYSDEAMLKANHTCNIPFSQY